jgi:hypothetical protein
LLRYPVATAADARFNHLTMTAYMFATAMIGPTRGVIEEQAPPGLMRVLHGQLVSLCLGYLEREGRAFSGEDKQMRASARKPVTRKRASRSAGQKRRPFPYEKLLFCALKIEHRIDRSVRWNT